MRRLALLSLALCSLIPRTALAQGVLDNVFLFRNFNQDARVATSAFGEASFLRNTYEFSSHNAFGLNVGIPLSERIEAALSVSYFSEDFDFGDGRSGLTDMHVYGKYNFATDVTRLATGAFVTLPIGSEDIGEGDLDYGAFVAARHPVQETTVLTGKISADLFDADDEDSEWSLRFHAGAIRQATEQVALIGELLFQTSVDLAQLSGGVDFALAGGGRLRASLALGLNDQSPDLSIVLGYLHITAP